MPADDVSEPSGFFCVVFINEMKWAAATQSAFVRHYHISHLQFHTQVPWPSL